MFLGCGCFPGAQEIKGFGKKKKKGARKEGQPKQRGDVSISGESAIP